MSRPLAAKAFPDKPGMIRLSVIPPEVLMDRRRKVAMGVVFPKARVDLPDRGRWRAWPGMIASILVHVALLATALGLTRGGGTEIEAPEIRSDPGREVAMVYLEPPPRPEPQPAAETPPPPQPSQQQPTEANLPSQRELPPPGPQSDEVLSPAPADETNTAQTEADEQAAPDPQTGNDDRQNVISTNPVLENGAEDLAAATEARGKDGRSMEEEARRIFGRPTTGTGNRNNALPWASDSTCVPDPTPPDPNAPVVLDSIAGIVFDQSGMALPGAHLQVVGTVYHGWSDDTGRYTLVFDVGLVANCRVQVVRVSAPGYRGRDLYLAMGQGNNDVYMQR